MRGYRTNYVNQMSKGRCFRDEEAGTVTVRKFDYKKGHHVYKTKKVKKDDRVVTLLIGIRDDEATLGVHSFGDGTLKSTADFQNCQKFICDMMLPEMMRDDKRNISISIPTMFEEGCRQSIIGLCELRGYQLILKYGTEYQVPSIRLG